MTPEQFIAEYAAANGKMPSRKIMMSSPLHMGEKPARTALSTYHKAHPEARRARGGMPRGTKMVPRKPAQPVPAPVIMPKTEWRETGDAATIECRESRTIRTLEELLSVAKVDVLLWSVDTHQVTKWDATVKISKDENAVVQMFRVHAVLKRRTEVADLRRLQLDTLEAIAAHVPTYGPILRPPNTGGHLLMLSPSDAHLGKIAWEAETGRDYDLKTAVDTVRHSLRTLTADAIHHGLERICLVIGNDFLQVDGNNDGHTTSRGTVVDTSDRYWRIYNAARDLLVSEIEWLTQFAPVTVLAVPGNHDAQSTLSLGALLEAWFRNNPEVTVNAGPTSRKYLSYGTVLLGFTHGDSEKHAALPQIMAAEQKRAWATATCREWITGHFHRKSERQYLPLAEEGGVIVRVLSALTRSDAWHVQRGYTGQAAGQAIVYSRTGLKAQYHHVPQVEAESA